MHEPNQEPREAEEGGLPEGYEPSPEFRKQMLWIAGVLYLLMFLCAVFGNQRWLTKPVSFLPIVDQYTWGAAAETLLGVAIGAAAGIVAVSIMRAIGSLRWLVELETFLTYLLGRLHWQESFLLALFSSVGEELLFRGFLQNWVGLVWASTIFGSVHFVSRRLWYYPLFATVMGFMFGGLYWWTGNLAAPILCHFTINYLNLQKISRRAEELGLA